MSSIFANFLSCTTCTNCFIISYLFRVTNARFIKEFYNTTKNICIVRYLSGEEFEEIYAGFATCWTLLR